MKRAVFVLIVLLTLISISIHAQDTEPAPRYRLRVPPVEEYLTAIPGILEQFQTEIPEEHRSPFDDYRMPFVDALLAQMWLSYDERTVYGQPHNVLADGFIPIMELVGNHPATHIYVDQHKWYLELFRAVMRSHDPALSRETHLSAEHTPVDFDGDGVYEYIVDLRGLGLRTFIVTKENPALPERYEIHQVLHWWNEEYTQYDSGYYTLDLRDITGDDNPEWILLKRGGSSGASVECNRLYIYSWQNHRLVEVLPDEINGCDPRLIGAEYGFDIGAWLHNIDGDSAQEMYADKRLRNIWDCEREERRILDWWYDRYIVRRTEIIRDEDTLGCAMLAAEPLLWENRASEAVPFYEHGLQVGWTEAVSTDFEPELVGRVELVDYARVRLALAYALSSRIDDALRILGEAEHSTSDLLNQMVADMRAASPTALGLCAAAYNIWREIEVGSFFYPWDILNISVGFDEPRATPFDNNPPQAIRAGCNIPVLIDTLLLSTTFNREESPVEQLEALGIETKTAEVFDLNGDGEQEWLVWPVALVDPIYFAPTATSYQLSRPTIRREGDYTQVFSHPTPENGQSVLVDWTYIDPSAFPSNSELYFYDLPGGNCLYAVNARGDDHRIRGDVRLWALRDNRLELILQAPLCTERASDDLFSESGDKLHAATIFIYAEHPSYYQYWNAVYRWDAHKRTYVPPQYIPAPVKAWDNGEEISIEPETGQLFDEALFDIYDQVYASFGEKNYAGVLLILDMTLPRVDSAADQYIVTALRYYRALSLVALDRPDEALAEYVAIIEAVPESAWGRLAALHVEVVDE